MMVDEILKRLEKLKLISKDVGLCENVAKVAILSVENYIKFEINPIIEFEKIKEIFIDLVIGDYLYLMKNTSEYEKFEIDDAIKTIREGDTSITYFEKKYTKIDALINYFKDKKKHLLSFKCVRW